MSGTHGFGRVVECLEITKHQFEFDVAIEYRAAVHPGDAQKTNVERVFVSADFRDARHVFGEGETQQLRDLRRRQHELKNATICNMAADPAIFTEHPQNDGRGRVNWLEGLDPAGKVISTRRGILFEPV